MVSRLTAFATVFAVLATAAIAVAAAGVQVRTAVAEADSPTAAHAKALPVLHLPAVTIVARRVAEAQ